MTMKYLNKNVSAENESIVFDIDIKRDESGKAKNVILKYKNFYTEEISDNFYDFLRDFYTKQEIDERIKVHMKIYETKELLDSATDEDAKKENFIYLVPYEGEEDNFEEYIWTKDENGDYSYERVGTTKVDLTPIWEAIDELDESKVDKEEGKGLSTNDFDNTYKTKLNNIENYANKTIVDESLNGESENPLQNKVIKSFLDSKVDKEQGKALSTNDFNNTYKNKLDAIDEGATKTVIDNELTDNGENPVQGKIIKNYVDTTVADSFQDMSDKLYGTEQTAGDLSVYLTSEDIYDGLNNSSTKLALSANQGRELKNALDGKANASHMHPKSDIQNFPAIVNNLESTDGVDSVLSANQGRVLKAMIDNIEVGSGGEYQLEDYVKTSDLAAIATSGDYEDLINLPKITLKVSNASIPNNGDFVGGTPSAANVVITFNDNVAIYEECLAIFSNPFQSSSSYSENNVQFKINDLSGYLYDTDGNQIKWGTFKKLKILLLHITDSSSTTKFVLLNPLLSTVAISGSYNDLSNKPTIPDVSGKEDISNKTEEIDINNISSNTQYPTVSAIQPLFNWVMDLAEASCEIEVGQQISGSNAVELTFTFNTNITGLRTHYIIKNTDQSSVIGESIKPIDNKTTTFTHTVPFYGVYHINVRVYTTPYLGDIFSEDITVNNY